MTDSFMPLMRALVAAALLLATATLMLVAVNTARAAGALAMGKCDDFGESYDFQTAEAAPKRPDEVHGTRLPRGGELKRGCAALAVDYVNPCGPLAGARVPSSVAPRMRRCVPATRTAARNASSVPFSATARADDLAVTLSV
jgi:hypothetical protein